jgi:hypothetical protein
MMSGMKCIIIGGIISTVVCGQAVAQQKTGDTTLRSTTIEVIQSYKPEVKPVPKPEFTPGLPPRDTSRPELTYEVPQQTLYFTYSALPLRPLALGKDTTILSRGNYIRLGGGNLSTIYLDGGISVMSAGKYEAAAHLHHLSQSGNIKNQRTSLSGIEAEGTVHHDGNNWRVSLEGLRNRYHYYGYDHDLFDYGTKSVRQTFTGVSVGLDVKNERPNAKGISYHPFIKGSLYTAERNMSENSVSFGLPVSKALDEQLTAGIGVNGIVTILSTANSSVNSNIFQVTPVITYLKGELKAKFGLYPSLSTGRDLALLPDIELAYRFPNTQFSLSTGFQGRLNQNSYRQLTTVNPYLGNGYDAGVTTRVDEVFGMLSSKLGEHVTVTGKVGWLQFSDLPMFLNDTGDHKNFYVLYDEKINAVSLEGSARYNVANNFSLGVSAIYYNYYKTTFSRVWHEPALRIKSDCSYIPVSGLVITAYATILDQIYTLNETQNVIKLDAIFDIGGGAEYNFTPRVSAFVQVNNLLNNQYQRWYKYQYYGLNLFAGVRFKF